MEPSDEHRNTIQQVVDDISRSWMKFPGVVGLGVGSIEDSPCIKVFFCDEQSLKTATIPNEIVGYRVIKEVSGEFFADS